MVFLRLFDNKLYPIKDVASLGFEESEGLRIPDEYLQDQEFVVLRTAHGIGDWGIISAMPRLLKQKYPNCKVFVPSEKMINSVFGQGHKNAYNIFHNNPYVDKFIDSIDGEVFHDQYRIYNKDILDIPLINQMLRFWQFSENEYDDNQPEIYWTMAERELGDKIIKSHTSDKFGCLLLSDRFGTQNGKYDENSFNRDTQNITKILKQYSIPYFYWSYKPLTQTPFDFIDAALDLRNVDLRIQLYIKSQAELNISNQCGTNHLVVRYSNVFEAQRQFPIKHNKIKGIQYL